MHIWLVWLKRHLIYKNARNGIPQNILVKIFCDLSVCDSLRAGRFGVQTSVGTGRFLFSVFVQTGPGAHPPLLKRLPTGLFSGGVGKAAEAWCWLLTLCSAEVKNGWSCNSTSPLRWSLQGAGWPLCWYLEYSHFPISFKPRYTTWMDSQQLLPDVSPVHYLLIVLAI